MFFGFRTYSAPAPDQFGFNTYADYNPNWPWIMYPHPDPVLVDTIDYYANLLIIQYIGKPKAYATIQQQVRGIVMDLLPNQVMNAYNLPGAVGVQLDVLGKYAGVTRTGYGPHGPITLNDSDFTKLVQLAILTNKAGSSLATIQQLLNQYFPGQIFVFDNTNMQLSYYLSSDAISLDLVSLFITEGLLPKPMGVQLASIVYAPTVDLNNFFGFVTYIQPVPTNRTGWSRYSSVVVGPVLNYDDVLKIT